MGLRPPPPGRKLTKRLSMIWSNMVLGGLLDGGGGLGGGTEVTVGLGGGGGLCGRGGGFTLLLLPEKNAKLGGLVLPLLAEMSLPSMGRLCWGKKKNCWGGLVATTGLCVKNVVVVVAGLWGTKVGCCGLCCCGLVIWSGLNVKPVCAGLVC